MHHQIWLADTGQYCIIVYHLCLCVSYCTWHSCAWMWTFWWLRMKWLKSAAFRLHLLQEFCLFVYLFWFGLILSVVRFIKFIFIFVNENRKSHGTVAKKSLIISRKFPSCTLRRFRLFFFSFVGFFFYFLFRRTRWRVMSAATLLSARLLLGFSSLFVYACCFYACVCVCFIFAQDKRTSLAEQQKVAL